MPKSDLPFGGEFSPEQLGGLRRPLELAHAANGDRNALITTVRAAFFESHSTSDENKDKLAGNTRLAMIAYGLLGRDDRLTELGLKLFALRDNEAALHEEFARHVLTKLNGSIFVQCIQDMQAAGEAVDLIALRERLEERNIHVPRGGRHPSTMKLWLQRVGVFRGGWQVDDDALQRVLGITPQEVEALAGLTPEQRAFLRTLANMGGGGPFLSNEVERLAGATFGVKFNEKSLPQRVLYPLRERGYVELERGTKALGRGSKPFRVLGTAKLQADVVGPLLEQFEQQIDPRLRKLLRLPLGAILMGLTAPTTHERGLALEALAFKLMRLLDLKYVQTRLRGESTGGAEVDLLFESSRPVYSRWQVQCKNTANGVALDDVAKEVGLTHLLKSNVVVVVSTGKIGAEARRFADRVMRDTNLSIVLVNRGDIDRVEQNPAEILDVFAREAKQAMKLRALSV